jgi:hypothetical protein
MSTSSEIELSCRTLETYAMGKPTASTPNDARSDRISELEFQAMLNSVDVILDPVEHSS